MKKIAIACAAAGMLLAAPNFIASASAAEGIKVAQVDVRIGTGGPDRRYHHNYRGGPRCSTKVIYRNGHKTVIKKCG
jgi:hypothetical protein